jgi:hypothetical protein
LSPHTPGPASTPAQTQSVSFFVVGLQEAKPGEPLRQLHAT